MKRTQSAFTLVELLVVITIIGILMGLLIPAVNSAREVARRNQCATQLKNFALAAVLYENSRGKLPGYVQDYGLYDGGSTARDPSDPTNTGVPRHKKIGTWAVAILSRLDAQPTFEHWTEDRYPVIVADPTMPPDLGSTSGPSGDGFHTLAAPNLAIFQCPSNPVSGGENGKNSYIYNNGMMHRYFGPTAPTASPPALPPIPVPGVSFFESQDRANGIGNTKYNVRSDGAIPPNFVHIFEGPKVRLDDLKDGQGFTMLFSENVQALPWHRAGLIDGADLETGAATDTDIEFHINAASPLGAKVEAARYIHGMVWHYEDFDFDNTPDMDLAWNRNGGSSNIVPVDVYSFHRINGAGTTVSDDIFTRTIRNLQDARDLARPSSAHVGGVNAGFADGQTRFVSQQINYRVYQALMTPRGKSSNVPWSEFVLTDELSD